MMDTRTEALNAHRRGDLSTAERLYGELLQDVPMDAEILHFMGVLCFQSGRNEDSIHWLHKALDVMPESLPTLQLLSRVCVETGDRPGALDALNRYLEQRPDDALLLNLKAQQLAILNRYQEAEPVFRQAAELSGKGPMFHDLGVCCQLLGDPAGAASAYEKAVRLGHEDPRTRLWLAQSLRATGRASDYYRVATSASVANPGNLELLIEAQSARRYICDWDGFSEFQSKLQKGLLHWLASDDGADIPPGMLNYLDIDEDLIGLVAKKYAAQLSASTGRPRAQQRKTGLEKKVGVIRLGYLSTDFFSHAVGSLVRDLFACHDRDRFRIYGYSLRHRPDAVQSRIEEGCDHYRDLSGHSAEEIIRIIQDDGIDILIDLAGYTSASLPAVMAARPAPVQISWLGYLGTSGGDFIDYIIADEVALPRGLSGNYSENVIRLPCFLPASPLPVMEKCLSRGETGFNSGEVVFCSFNQPYKLDRTTFGAWMEILRRVPAGRLWLYEPDTGSCEMNLLYEAGRLGVSPNRLVFAPRLPMAQHVARVSLADLALDPFHISGGATSVASFAAGVPVLTLAGDSFLARMGSSINSHLGLSDLDSHDAEEYVEKAVALAANPLRLEEAKNRLGEALEASEFFKISAFVLKLEEALLTVWNRYERGLAMADVTVSQPPSSEQLRKLGR